MGWLLVREKLVANAGNTSHLCEKKCRDGCSHCAPLESDTIVALLENLLVDMDRYRAGLHRAFQAMIFNDDFNWSSWASRMAEYRTWRGVQLAPDFLDGDT